jgi:hypothetical protein
MVVKTICDQGYYVPALSLSYPAGNLYDIHPVSRKSVGAGIGSIAICSYYIYIDLKILLKKKK